MIFITTNEFSNKYVSRAILLFELKIKYI